MKNKTYRGYTIGKKYRLNVPVTDETGQEVPAGTIIRLVSIAPKVRMVTGKNKDTWMYFYNAVRANQADDYNNRIRENFITIKKL